MKSRILFSPFMAYCLSFLLVIPIYLLDWSYLFPKLTFPLLFFFLITFCIAILGCLFFKNLLSLQYKKQVVGGMDLYATLLVLFYLMDFAYSRVVPLVAVANNVSSYVDIADKFGIPVFHVFIVGFTAFISVYFFHSYLSQKKIKYLLYYILTIVLPLLIVSRITITFIFIASIYVYLMSIQKNFLGKLFKIAIAAMLFFAAFGFIGNIRSADAGELILEIGEAKPSFKGSLVPDPYFWAYLYIASPLANLQLNLDRREVPFTESKLIQLIIHEFFWDSFSKRIDTKYDFKRTEITQLNGALNVGSVFAKPYVYLGVWGMYLMYGYIFILTALFLFTLNTESKYFVTYIACFNTLVVLCIFDNLFAYTPLGILVVFPLIEKIKHFFIISKASNE
jgi:oligosaccharide repeat unit polymerase